MQKSEKVEVEEKQISFLSKEVEIIGTFSWLRKTYCIKFQKIDQRFQGIYILNSQGSSKVALGTAFPEAASR